LGRQSLLLIPTPRAPSRSLDRLTTVAEHVKRPNNLPTLQRRHALGALASAPLGALAGPVYAQNLAPGTKTTRAVTPAQSLGPFYPRSSAERPRETDADLVALQGERVLARGTPLYLTGLVFDRAGRTLAGAEVEIWQCDANAVYHHPAGGAEGERDPHFQGYGRTVADADGAFHFRTIRPVPYPGRTPHIHVRVVAKGHAPLATQLYLRGESGNARDFLFRQLSEPERNALSLDVRPNESAHPLALSTRLAARIDLVLA
jgi:protocatechuate 3,4-dioxygenase, beta subunit